MGMATVDASCSSNSSVIRIFAVLAVSVLSLTTLSYYYSSANRCPQQLRAPIPVAAQLDSASAAGPQNGARVVTARPSGNSSQGDSLFREIRRTGSCRPEVVAPATDALFNLLLDRAPGELAKLYDTLSFEAQHPSGLHLAFRTKKPFDLMSSRDKRNFIAMVSQQHCPSNQESDLCRVPGMQAYIIPAGIHAMSGGGEGYVAGGLEKADMVTEAIQLADPTIDFRTFFNGADVLDWGGSSGRSTAAMTAAFPNSHGYVADPIRASVSWVIQNLAKLGVQGYASPINPPTKYADQQFKLIFAISIWSHYNFGTVALPWLEEMRRIIAPDGFLVITTNGWPAVFSKITNDTLGTAEKVYDALSDSSIGQFYVRSFPDNVDWDADARNPDWGVSWVDPGWLHERTSGHWNMVAVLPARDDCLQDVIVLRPRV